MTHAEEPTLAAVLQRAALQVTDTQAVIACAAGTAATAALALLAPGWWRLALATGSAAAFGGWIIAARSGLTPRLATVTRATLLTLGVGAAFAFGLSVLMSMLGTWIS